MTGWILLGGGLLLGLVVGFLLGYATGVWVEVESKHEGMGEDWRNVT